MPVHLTDAQHEIVAAAAERLLPGDPAVGAPGARAGGVADYVDQLLGAFAFDPPRIWAGGPFSGRHGGEAGFEDWLELSRLEELAWRIRIEGSRGRPEREINGPVRGWQEVYADGLAALGDDFARLPPEEQDDRLGAPAAEELRALLFEHTCEGLYGDPVYGGNRDGAGWAFIAFPGDVQPRGWTDTEVTFPTGTRPGGAPDDDAGAAPDEATA